MSWVTPSRPMALFWNGIILKLTVLECDKSDGVFVSATISLFRTFSASSSVVTTLSAWVQIVWLSAAFWEIECGDNSSTTGGSAPMRLIRSSVAILKLVYVGWDWRTSNLDVFAGWQRRQADPYFILCEPISVALMGFRFEKLSVDRILVNPIILSLSSKVFIPK